MYEWARLGSNQQPLVCETSALPLSYSPSSGPGGSRTLEPPPPFTAATTAARLLCRALSYPAHEFQQIRDKDRTSIPTFRAWCPAVGRSRSAGRRRRGVPSVEQTGSPLRPARRRSTQQRLFSPRTCVSFDDRTAERCCPCHSPTLRPWIADRRLRTSAAAGVLRGGALEPRASCLRVKNGRLKRKCILRAQFFARAPRVFLSQAGPRIDLVLLKLGITSLWLVGRRLPKRRRRPVGSPSSGLLCG